MSNSLPQLSLGENVYCENFSDNALCHCIDFISEPDLRNKNPRQSDPVFLLESAGVFCFPAIAPAFL